MDVMGVVKMDILNLSNGLFCREHCSNPLIVTRIQSTALEQKRWEAVIHGAGPEFFYRLATEKQLIFHDWSERRRLTRAFWQGVPFLLHIFNHCMGLPEVPALMRGGARVNTYFNRVITELSPSVLKEVVYFKKYLVGRGSQITPCLRRLDVVE